MSSLTSYDMSQLEDIDYHQPLIVVDNKRVKKPRRKFLTNTYLIFLPEEFYLCPSTMVKVNTSLIILCPIGYCAKISSNMTKSGLFLPCRTIYFGNTRNVFLEIHNFSQRDIHLRPNTAFAQISFEKIEHSLNVQCLCLSRGNSSDIEFDLAKSKSSSSYRQFVKNYLKVNSVKTSTTTTNTAKYQKDVTVEDDLNHESVELIDLEGNIQPKRSDENQIGGHENASCSSPETSSSVVRVKTVNSEDMTNLIELNSSDHEMDTEVADQQHRDSGHLNYNSLERTGQLNDQDENEEEELTLDDSDDDEDREETEAPSKSYLQILLSHFR